MDTEEGTAAVVKKIQEGNENSEKVEKNQKVSRINIFNLSEDMEKRSESRKIDWTVCCYGC